MQLFSVRKDPGASWTGLPWLSGPPSPDLVVPQGFHLCNGIQPVQTQGPSTSSRKSSPSKLMCSTFWRFPSRSLISFSVYGSTARILRNTHLSMTVPRLQSPNWGSTKLATLPVSPKHCWPVDYQLKHSGLRTAGHMFKSKPKITCGNLAYLLCRELLGSVFS